MMPDTQSYVYPQTETGRMRRFIDEWLGREEWQFVELARLLQGYDLPVVSPEAGDPYIWILDGLGTGDIRVRNEKILAKRLAAWIEQKPDSQELDPDSRRAVYNLLMLCSEIRRPEYLAEPLFGMLERAALPAAGHDLGHALRRALIMNPPGRQLEQVWCDMAQGNGHSFLPTNRYDAFNGVLLLPRADGEPPLRSLSIVMKALAEDLASKQAADSAGFTESQRDEIINGLIDRLIEADAGELRTVLQLIWWTYFHEWPQWARAMMQQRLPTSPELDDYIRDIEEDFRRWERNRRPSDRLRANVASYVMNGYQFSYQSTHPAMAGVVRRSQEARLTELGVLPA